MQSSLINTSSPFIFADAVELVPSSESSYIFVFTIEGVMPGNALSGSFG